MIPTVWEIISLSMIVFSTIVFLYFLIQETWISFLISTMNRKIEIKSKLREPAFACTFVLICWMIVLIHEMVSKQIAWGTILTMTFTVAGISVSVLLCVDLVSKKVLLCVIKNRLDRHVEDLVAAVAKLHGMQNALCPSKQIPFAKQYRRWLKNVRELHHTAQDIKVKCDRLKNYSLRVHLSRRARQGHKTANDLLRQGDNLMHPQDQLRGTTNFYKKKVIDFIKDMADDSGLLGIWGMGGVGKTSLLKLLVSDSRSEYDNDSFQVLFVRAGTGCTVGQVQEAIAASMGLSLEHNETSQAKIIHDQLEETSFLLLLDDLWWYLDLKAVGIPSPLGTVRAHLEGGVVGQKQRKVVLTSRNMDLCHKMGCSRDKTIQMKCLDEVDAWNLFDRGWPVPRVDVIEKLPPTQTSSSSSHTGRQLPIRKWRTTSEVRTNRLSELISSYEKMRYFIEERGARSSLMGVWGMPGVGKTTLLRLVRDSYTLTACFDHILFVGAGTGHMVNNVQHAIAISLGLDLVRMSSLDEFSRAKLIFNYLEHKSFLLLLDDIREPLNWWAIGLPLSLHKQQKFILATRSEAACALMGCHVENTIEMQCLEENDAWNLFADKAGLSLIYGHPQVDQLARQMVSRCGGLPLALCSLGRAMSNKRDPKEWRSAYSQLTAMRLDPCEIDEKVGTILFNSL